MIVQTYSLHAAAGRRDETLGAMRELASWLEGQEGCLGAQILCDTKETDAFLFLETWQDDDHRTAAGAALDKDLMGRLMGSLGARPAVTSYAAVERTAG